MSLSNVLRTRSINAAALVVCCVFAFAVFGNEVNAAPVTAADNAFARFMSVTTGAGSETISFGSNGTPVLSPSAGTISTGGGNIKVTRTGALGLPGGAKLPITATAKIPGAGAASLIKKALPLVGLAAAGPLGVALTNLAFEMGYDLVFGFGDPEVRKADPAVCTNSPCYNYRGSQLQGWSSTAEEACWVWSTFNGKTYVSVSGNPGEMYCASNPGNFTFQLMAQSKAVSQPSYVASTDQELADSIANKTGWPDSSAIAEALNQSQRATGGTIPTEGPQVTGPTSVDGPAEVTKKPIPNGTRETTTQTDYNCVYVDGATVMDGGTVACTQKTTTTDKDTVTDPQTQQTTTTTTQTSETTKPADTTAEKPKETVDPCDKNPDRVGCATLDTPDGDIPKVTKTFNYQYEELGLGNGSCPAPASTITMLGTFSVDLTAYCDAISTFVRPLVILFGMLAAFIIASPVKVDL